MVGLTVRIPARCTFSRINDDDLGGGALEQLRWNGREQEIAIFLGLIAGSVADAVFYVVSDN